MVFWIWVWRIQQYAAALAAVTLNMRLHGLQVGVQYTLCSPRRQVA